MMLKMTKQKKVNLRIYLILTIILKLDGSLKEDIHTSLKNE